MLKPRIVALLRAFKETGIHPEMSPEEAQHIRFFNIWSVTMCLLCAWTCFIVSFTGLYFVTSGFGALTLLFISVLCANHRGLYRLARWGGFVIGHAIFLWLVITGARHGIQNPDAQYGVVLFVIEGAIIMPREETTFLKVMMLLSLLVFSLTLWMLNPVVHLPDLTYRVVQIALIYGFFVVFAAFGMIFRHIWFSTQEQLRKERADRVVLTERTRIAREIHDSLAQCLTGISIHLHGISQVVKGICVEGREHIDVAKRLVRDGLAESRLVVWNLRSGSLESGSVCGALSDMARLLTAGTEIEIQIENPGNGFPQLPAQCEAALIRVGRESITNAIKHSQCRRIKIQLSHEPTQVKMRVLDDGRGFMKGDPPGAESGHFGVEGMRERAKELHGALTISSRAGEGTEVELILPLPPGNADPSAVNTAAAGVASTGMPE